jgi:type IV secretory pathway component VirB8
MNAISRRPEPHDDDKVGSVIIPANELARLYEEQKQERARIRRRDRFKWVISGSAFAGIVFIAVAEAAVISYLLPLKEIIPITTHVRDDGTTTTAVKWESLPKPVREDVTVNVVWSYVQQRESWSAGNAGWAWTMVSALSAPRVRESFQNWYRADNPQSPAQIYRDMTVEANFVRWEPICPIEKACIADGPPAYRVWFDRVETLPDGKRMPPVRYAATVAIKRNVELPQDRIWQRWTFNAPQIQVIEYAGAQREGVSR